MFLDVKLLYGTVTIAFFDCVNKEAMYSVCILRLKISKQALKEVNSSQKAKSKEPIMFVKIKIEQDRYDLCNYKKQ